MAIGLTAGAAAAQDPERRHDLDELASRQGDKPWIRLWTDGQFASERTIFRDTLTGAEIWRLTDDPREDRHDYYDIPAWNSEGTALILVRENGVANRLWVMPADASWTKPVADFTIEALLDPEMGYAAASAESFWSWADPNALYSNLNGVISIVSPRFFEKTEIFDLMTSDEVNDPNELPLLEGEDFSMQPPHPLDDRLLFHTKDKGRLFTLDLAAEPFEVHEIPTDGRWEIPSEHSEEVGVHRLRWTKEPGQYRVFVGQDNMMVDGELVEDSRQYLVAMDGELVDHTPEGEDNRGGHPDMSMLGDAITGTYKGYMWKMGTDGSEPNRKIYLGRMDLHHSSCTWDSRWLAVDNSVYRAGAPPFVLRGFDAEGTITLVSTDGRAQNVLNYPHSSYAVDESTHPAPASSPDATKIAYDSDMLDRALAGGGDGDGNPDLWMVVVRPPSPPRDVTARSKSTKVRLSWKRPLHGEEEIYWNPGNEAREIRGYHVYRGLSSGGPYEQLNVNVVVAESYDDTTVEPGVRYYYVIQSVEHSGLASLYSREVFASTTSRRWQGEVSHFYEAEAAEMTLPMVPQFEPGVTNGDWWAGTFAQEPDPDLPLEPGPAAVTFTVSSPLVGDYTIWAKVKGFDLGGYFDVEVDGVPWGESFVVTPGDWEWVALPSAVRLRAGTRQIRLSTLDPEIGIDMLAIRLGLEGEPPPLGNRDVIAPEPPSDARLASVDGSTKQITWSPSPDSDVSYYNVYCGRDAAYALDNHRLLRSPAETELLDWGIPDGIATVYKITAVDRHGNESEPVVFDPGVQNEESAPDAYDDNYEIDEDEPLDVPALGVLANDIDGDGDVMTATLVTGVENGVLDLSEDGGFTYTPNLEFAGVDSFTYIASDEFSKSDIATVTITIGVVDDAPIAWDDAYSLDEDAIFEVGPGLGVLTNDTDAEGETLVAILDTDAEHGELTLEENGSLRYEPFDHFHGTDSFTYHANDGVSDSNVATVIFTVLPVEDLPVANTDIYTIDEDTILNLPEPGVLANDVDYDGDPLQAFLEIAPANGLAQLSTNGSLIYTPDPHFNGYEVFSYYAFDGKGSSEPKEIRITVNALNDVPVANDDAYYTDEDVVLDVPASGVLINDTDADGDKLYAYLVTDVEHGTLNLKVSGAVTYTPDANFNGVDRFTYYATDSKASSAPATVTLTVGAFNDSPVAVADVYTVDEDAVLQVTAPGVLANDFDPDGQPITAILVTGTAEGELTLQSNGSFEYTPPANFDATETFTYVASDGITESAPATVQIVVTPVNDAPVAGDDSYQVEEDGLLQMAAPGVLANDSDIDGDKLDAVLVGGAQNGILTLNSNGSMTYRPHDGFNGVETLTYFATDDIADSNLATVTITVTPVNDGPTAVLDFLSMDEDAVLDLAAPGVLVNDSDPDGDPLTAELVTAPLNGSLDLHGDGGLIYTPNANFEGVDDFYYLVSDGIEESGSVRVRITVNAVNDAPVAMDDSYQVAEDGFLVIDNPGVLANDSDVDGDGLDAILDIPTAHGTLALNANGKVTYNPNDDFNGVDSFTYWATDGEADSNIATVTITVTPVNDGPLAENDFFGVDEDNVLEISVPGVLANDSDIDGDPLEAMLVTGASNGTVDLAADGRLIYTPLPNFEGVELLTYRVTDGQLESADAQIRIDIHKVNDPPVATGEAYVTAVNTVLVVDPPGVLLNDTDVDDTSLTAVLVTDVTSGTLVLKAGGSVRYTPNPGFTGQVSFTYKASDGEDTSAPVTVTITVQ